MNTFFLTIIALAVLPVALAVVSDLAYSALALVLWCLTHKAFWIGVLSVIVMIGALVLWTMHNDAEWQRVQCQTANKTFCYSNN